MSLFHLTILTPDGKIFDGKAEAISAPGQEGSLGVLGGHAPMLAALKQGTLKISTEDQTLYFEIEPGILEISAEHNVLVLCDRATPSSGTAAPGAASHA